MSAEAEAQPVSVLRVDFVREMTDGSGNRTVIERGHHFIADSGACLMDKVSNGERISEIWLPASGERVVVNHDLRFAIRGPPGRGLADPGDPGVVGADRRVPSGFPGAAWIRGARFPVESGAAVAAASAAAAWTTIGVTWPSVKPGRVGPRELRSPSARAKPAIP